MFSIAVYDVLKLATHSFVSARASYLTQLTKSGRWTLCDIRAGYVLYARVNAPEWHVRVNSISVNKPNAFETLNSRKFEFRICFESFQATCAPPEVLIHPRHE